MSLLDAKLNAYTLISVAFVQPASDSNVIVNVDSSAWMPVGLAVFCENGGAYLVVERTSDDTVKLKNTGASGNAAPGATIPVGSLMAAGSATPGSGGFIVTGTPALGDVPTWDGSQWITAGRSALAITAFAAVNPVVETGATVVNPAFTAAENFAPTSLLLTNNANGESKDVHTTPTSMASSQSYTSSTPGHVDTFTLTGNAPGSPTATRTATQTRGQRNYAGVVAIGASFATLVGSATVNALDVDGSFAFTLTDDGTHQLGFGRPARFGAATLKDANTGFGVSITLVSSASFTNASGFAEAYNYYKVDAPVNGTLSGVVS